MTNRTCRICGVELPPRKRVLCGSEECRKRNDANWMRDFQRKHKAEHGIWYSRQYEEDKALKSERGRRRNAEIPVRTRYPAQFAAKDARRRMRVAEATVEQFDPIEIFERDGWICQICSEPVDRNLAHPDPLSRSLDHIMPISRGGDHSRQNTQLAHLACNVSKRDRIPQ